MKFFPAFHPKTRWLPLIVVTCFALSVLTVYAASWQDADFNTDGVINSMDIVEMFKFFGCPNNCPTTSPTPTPGPTSAPGQWTDCQTSRLGANLMRLDLTSGGIAYTGDNNPEARTIGAESVQQGYTGFISSMNPNQCAWPKETFASMTNWDKMIICDDHNCLTQAATTCSGVSFQYLAYGPEHDAGLTDNLTNLQLAVQTALQITQGQGKQLYLSFSTSDLHQLALNNFGNWQAIDQVVQRLLQEHPSVGPVNPPAGWLLQAADERTISGQANILSQIYFDPVADAAAWRAEVQKWVSAIHAVDPDIRIWIQMAVHRMPAAGDPALAPDFYPEASIVLNYREPLVNPSYGPPLIDGVLISSFYSWWLCPGEASCPSYCQNQPTCNPPGHEVSDAVMVEAFRCACGQNCSSGPPPTGAISVTPLPSPNVTPPRSPTPRPTSPPITPPPGQISLVEEGWTNTKTIPTITLDNNYYYRIYTNTRYPCGNGNTSTSQGYHQFMVIEPGSYPTVPATSSSKHLFAKFLGGGMGFWFYNQNGTRTYYAQPDAVYIQTQDYNYNMFFRASVSQYAGGVTKRLRENGNWRLVIPSYCSHDLYLGKGSYHSTDGFTRYGYLAAKEAVEYVQNNYTTNKTITYGGSAGAANFSVAQDLSRIDGIIMDSFSLDLKAFDDACAADGQHIFGPSYPCFCTAVNTPPGCTQTTNGSGQPVYKAAMQEFADRVDFSFNQDEPHVKIQQSSIDIPLYLIWNERDASNKSPQLYNNLHNAINTYDPAGVSRVNMDGSYMCITDPLLSIGPVCNLHVPSGFDYTEADYLTKYGTWPPCSQAAGVCDDATSAQLVDQVYTWINQRIGL